MKKAQVDASSPEGNRGSLWDLLGRFCDDALLKRIRSDIEKLQQSEEQLPGKAAGISGEKRGGDESFYLEAAITECEGALPKESFLDLANEAAALSVTTGDYPTAERLADLVVERAGSSLRFARAAGMALTRRAEIFLRQAKWEQAHADLHQAAKHFTRAKDQLGLARVENHLGISLAERGELKEATAHMRKARSMFERAKQAEMSAVVTMDLGILANIQGKHDEALIFYQQVLPRFEELGSLTRLAELHHNYAMMYLAKGEHTEALGQFDMSLGYSARAEYKPLIGLSYLGKSALHQRQGDYPLAGAFANRALSVFRELDDQLGMADVYKVKAGIQRAMGNLDVAELYLQTSIRINEEYRNPLNLAESYDELGQLALARGEEAPARAALERAKAHYRIIGARSEGKRIELQLTSLTKGKSR